MGRSGSLSIAVRGLLELVGLLRPLARGLTRVVRAVRERFSVTHPRPGLLEVVLRLERARVDNLRAVRVALTGLFGVIVALAVELIGLLVGLGRVVTGGVGFAHGGVATSAPFLVLRTEVVDRGLVQRLGLRARPSRLPRGVSCDHAAAPSPLPSAWFERCADP